MDLAKEKSEYAYYLTIAINIKVSQAERNTAISKLTEIEHRVKSESNDEIIFIVTTSKTNPMKDKTAKPMSMENIKNHE